MNKLSKRLEKVADYVKADSKIIDIGCDHGLLSIFLANKYPKIKIIASDINENALNSAIQNIQNSHLEKRIDTRLGKGLEVVNPEEINTVVIAGMGSNTIVGILKYAKDKLSHVDTIIVQSNTDLYFLRKNITMLGYYIEDETLVEEKDIIYTIIKFVKGRKRYNYKELYFGPVLLASKDSLFKKKMQKEYKTIQMILKNIDKGHYFYRLKLKRNARLLKEVISTN